MDPITVLAIYLANIDGRYKLDHVRLTVQKTGLKKCIVSSGIVKELGLIQLSNKRD